MLVNACLPLEDESFDETVNEALRHVLSDHDDGLDLLAGRAAIPNATAGPTPHRQRRLPGAGRTAPQSLRLAGRSRRPVRFSRRYSPPGSVFQHKADREVSFRR